jgi:hypothetical protein
MSEGSFLAGLNSAMKAISDPEKWGPQFFTNIASQAVPLGSAQRFVNRAGFDDKQRVGDTVKDRLIGGTLMSKTLPPRMNSLGQEIMRKPFFPSASDADPVYSELDRLGINGPNTTSRVTVGQQKFRLSPDQQRELQRGQGVTYNALRSVMADPSYKAAPPAVQEQIVKRVIQHVGSGANRAGKARLIPQLLRSPAA